MKSRKEIILDTVSDLVGDFLFYDRREDEDLPRYAIDEAIREGEISFTEIIDHFRNELVNGLELD